MLTKVQKSINQEIILFWRQNSKISGSEKLPFFLAIVEFCLDRRYVYTGFCRRKRCRACRTGTHNAFSVHFSSYNLGVHSSNATLCFCSNLANLKAKIKAGIFERLNYALTRLWTRKSSRLLNSQQKHFKNEVGDGAARLRTAPLGAPPHALFKM